MGDNFESLVRFKKSVSVLQNAVFRALPSLFSLRPGRPLQQVQKCSVLKHMVKTDSNPVPYNQSWKALLEQHMSNRQAFLNPWVTT